MLASKAKFCQHLIERFWGGDSRSGMGCLCRPLEGTFVEFNHTLRRVVPSDRRRLQPFVVKRHGEFTFVQVGAEENMEAIASNNSFRGRRSAQRVEQRLRGEADLCEGKAAAQPQILKRGKVQHAASMEG